MVRKKDRARDYLTGDERRHPLLEHGHPVHASPPVGIIPPCRAVVFYFARESSRAMDYGLNKNQSRIVISFVSGVLLSETVIQTLHN